MCSLPVMALLGPVLAFRSPAMKNRESCGSPEQNSSTRERVEFESPSKSFFIL